MEEVIAHAVDDDCGDLGTTWSVEVRHGMAAVLAAERGKLIADDVYWRHVRRTRINRWSHVRTFRLSAGIVAHYRSIAIQTLPLLRSQ